MYCSPMAQLGGSMVARRPLPDEHHIMRYIPAARRFVDEEGNRLGPSAGGFTIRGDDAGGLSVTEIEHFGQMTATSRAAAAVAHRSSLPSKKVGLEAIYAWAQVSNVKSAAISYGKQIRVVHDPVPNNPGHAEIRHFTDEDLDLLEYFATTVFDSYETVATMKLPNP